MTKYTSFAVAGVGGIGIFVAGELAKQPGVTVIGLTRAGSDKRLPAGVVPREVDYDDEGSLVAALQGVQVVVSTIAQSGFEIQPLLANAAKKAGVAVFAPSEFGGNTSAFTEGPYQRKHDFQKYLKSINLPYALFYTGGFADAIFIPLLGFDFAKRAVTITGSGYPRTFSFTSRTDIGRYVAHVLTHLGPSSLKWSTHRIEGFHVSPKQVIATYEEVKGIELEISYRDVEEVKKNAPFDLKDITKFGDWLTVLWAEGYSGYNGLVGEPLTNHLVPKFNPEGLRDVIEKYY